MNMRIHSHVGRCQMISIEVEGTALVTASSSLVLQRSNHTQLCRCTNMYRKLVSMKEQTDIRMFSISILLYTRGKSFDDQAASLFHMYIIPVAFISSRIQRHTNSIKGNKQSLVSSMKPSKEALSQQSVASS